MEVREILECCLYAENLDQTADWYADLLGLAEFSRTPGRNVFFRVGGRCFFLFNPASTRDPASTQIGVPVHGAAGEGHVCFAIAADELDAWRVRLREKAVAIEREIEWPNGARSLYFRDPARNSVELSTPSLWGIDENKCFAPRASQ